MLFVRFKELATGAASIFSIEEIARWGGLADPHKDYEYHVYNPPRPGIQVKALVLGLEAPNIITVAFRTRGRPRKDQSDHNLKLAWEHTAEALKGRPCNGGRNGSHDEA